MRLVTDYASIKKIKNFWFAKNKLLNKIKGYK